MRREKPRKVGTGRGRFASGSDGRTAIEYGLIAALVAVVIISALTALGTGLGNKFENVAAEVPNAYSSSGGGDDAVTETPTPRMAASETLPPATPATETEAAEESAEGTPLSPPTATATEQPKAPAVLKDTLCWKGPGPLYEVVSSLKAGVEPQLLGRGENGGWWVVDNPRYPGVPCWLQEGDLEVDPIVELSEFEIFPVPPPPTPTPTEKPEIEGCLYKGPNDNKPVCYSIDNCPVDFDDSEGACKP